VSSNREISIILISYIIITNTYHPDDSKLCLIFFIQEYKNLLNNVWLTKQRIYSLAVLNIQTYLKAKITTAHFHTKGQVKVGYTDYRYIKKCKTSSTSVGGCCESLQRCRTQHLIKLLNILHIQHHRLSGFF